MERRFFIPKEEDLSIRAYENDKGEKFIEGYAAVYNVYSRILSEDGIPFREIILPNSFDSVLTREDLDVIYNFNHDRDKVFARTLSQTLTLSSDEKGLKFTAKIDPNISEANDLYLRIKRGDIFENSFAFRIVDENKQEWRYENVGDEEILTRTIKGFDGLYDVSSVTNAAYPNTSLNVRNIKNNLEINNKSEDETTEEDNSERERLQLKVKLKLID